MFSFISKMLMKVLTNKNTLLCKDNITKEMNLIKKLTRITKSLISLLEDTIDWGRAPSITESETFALMSRYNELMVEDSMSRGLW